MDTDTPVRSDAVCLYIPVKHSRDKVTVPLEALPKDPDVLLDIFKAEEVRACARASRPRISRSRIGGSVTALSSSEFTAQKP